MIQTREDRVPARGTTVMLALFSLSLWQLRQTWRFLLLTGIGMIAATMLVCVGPLYSQVVLNASLRNFLAERPENATISLQGRLQAVNAANVKQVTTQFNQLALQDIGPVIKPAPQFFIRSSVLSILNGEPSEQQASGEQAREAQAVLNGYGQEMADHTTLLAGRLPRVAQGEVEIAITPAMVQKLKLNIGDVFYTHAPIISLSTTAVWKVRVVGLFVPKLESDPFWQGTSFKVTQLSDYSPYFTFFLASSAGLIDAYEHLQDPTNVRTPQLGWIYSFDPASMEASKVDAVIKGMKNFLSDAANANAQMAVDATTTPGEQMTSYSSHMALAQVSVMILLVLVTGMILLFVTLMADLLIEQRTEAIALLRSRGASRRQVFAVFALQCSLMAVLALCAGPLLAVPVTQVLLTSILPVQDHRDVLLFMQDWFKVALSIWQFAVIAVVITLVTVLFAIYRETGSDVLALRREAGRSTRRPLWQRLYLDAFLLVLACVSYGYALYAINATSLDAQASVQTLSPVVLLSSAFFLLACILLFLRFFAPLIRWATMLASIRGSVSSMLALAQMARAPRNALRMTLLFALTTAFTIFALVFTTSQTQRAIDVSSYQVGADFSGAIKPVTDTAKASKVLKEQSARYRALRGVDSATLGFMGNMSGNDTPIKVKAVDIDTYGKTGIWSKQYSSQSLPELMKALQKERSAASKLHVIPAIVGAQTWKNLNLESGTIFPLTVTYTNPAPQANEPSTTSVVYSFQALKQVENIPTIDTFVNNQIFEDATKPDQIGILVDYQTFASVYTYGVEIANAQAVTYVPKTLPLNYLWVRTKENANLPELRKRLALEIDPNAGLADKQAFVNNLQHDPFYLDIQGMLILCLIAPLFLALLGSLMSSWLTAQGRLSNFALLRALGSAPRQLASILSWEQGIVYTIMFTLGIAAGTVLSIMVLPTLILTNVASIDGKGTANAASIMSNLPPIQVVIPPTLWIIMGVLSGICIVALTTMIIIVSRPSISQTLRLNVD